MDQDYLLKQKPLWALFVFSLPMVIGNLFQQTYTMADSAIVGRYVSEAALAAVGASYALTNIFIFVAVGGGIGASVLVSRYFGAKEYDRMKTTVYTALITFFAISLVLSGIGFLFGKSVMQLLNTPPEVLDMATEYLNIYFLGLPFLFMYNVLSAMFNALGKSKIPLYFLIFSSVFNIILDYVLVRYAHMGVAGVAWATLIAQSISAVLSFVVLLLLFKKMDGTHSRLFCKKELRPMFKIALPSILQQSTVSIGMMLVQSVVNSFGPEALAGFSAAMRIESLCVVPMLAVGNAVSSYTAQNLGAGNEKRVVKGYHASNILVGIFALIIMAMLEFFNGPIIRMFLGENGTQKALDTGCNYLAFMGFFFCLIGFKMTADGLLRGAGDMKMFTIANLINLGIRVAIAMIFAPKYGIQMIWISVPIGWGVNFLLSYIQYRTGKWKAIFKTHQQIAIESGGCEPKKKK